MSITTWLFLFIAGLVELAIRFRVSFGHSAAAVLLLLPAALALVVAPGRAPIARARQSFALLGSLLALSCAVLFARAVNLDFWNPERLDLAVLVAGLGIGSWLTVREDDDELRGSLVNGLLVALGWLLAYLWTPAGPWLVLAAASTLSLWGRDPAPSPARAGPSAVSALFWIGLALPKAWWDSESLGALSTALWGVGFALSAVPRIRDLPLPRPLLALALIPLAYVWVPLWLWAPALGLVAGLALRRCARPWPRAIVLAALGGLLLSYAVHSNLQIAGPLVWGAL